MTATFPQAPLDLEVGLQLAGTWTDITSYAYQREGTSPPVTISRGRADESAQVNPSAMSLPLNNRDGRFTVRNPNGPYFGQLTRNTPVRASVPAQTPYLRLENDAVSYAACPNTAGLGITGDIDLRIEIAPSSYAPCVLATKWDGGGSWAWLLNANGTMQWWWFDSGAVSHTEGSSLPVPLGHIALRVTMAVAAGTVTFWTAPAISGPWTQLGQPAVFGATSLLAAAGAVQVGYSFAWSTAGFAGFQGRIYAFQVLNGIGGTLEASPNFAAQTAGTFSFNDAQGNTWTLWNTAEISGRDYRFHGEMSSLPATWDSSGKDVWTPAEAAGLLRRLGQGNAPLYSSIKRALLAQSGTLAVHQYWPCEDLQGSAVIGSAVGGPLMTLAGGTGDGQVTFTGPAFASDTTFLCSAALPVLNGSCWRGSIPAYTSNGSIIVRFLMKLGSTLPGSSTAIMRVITNGSCMEFSLHVYPGYGLGIAGYNTSGATVFDTGAVSGLAANGQQLWVSMELQPGTGSTVNYSIVTLVPGATTAESFSGSFTGTIGNATAVYVNPLYAFTNTVIGHVSIQSGWESLFNLGSPLDAWQGELAANRFARLCGENGITARIYGPPAASAAMGAQSPQTLTQLLQEIEDTDRGQIYEPRQVLGLGYRPQAGLYNQAPAVTIDYSQAKLGGEDLKPTYDDQFTRNDITVQRSSGNVSGASYRYLLNDGSSMSISAPPGGAGDYSDSRTVNVQADIQLPDEAGWMVHTGTVNEARWPIIPVNMARAAAAAIYWAVLGCDIGDYPVIVNPPAQMPPDPVRQLIWGTREELGGYWYQIKWNAVPESPYETAIFDDLVYGRADTDGASLNSGVSAAATSLQVATTDPATPLWTTAAADVPFDINIDGERITVTAITGATSPQTFTVTRSVNGVSKTHAAGADVRLWFPPVYAMF